ncbi:5-dehydro-4-deoxy-D-glucuronate isomerase [Rubrivirga sp. SAORIC476]|uniref:5-dehydro-4-deoxy-D-glucuronate isomerase n=1 Tax=Rubrivirga sp. SAORIC476 TaxID=1961794 RepID=UPI000BA8EE22|nr:5-dehydro-4-deoxy-D-glucuronate isomerase [Rubrivirga sp. SAORIC476]PAP80887.1 5-dehydro-4-deoxy-D-glucuronate isomerase [Rubrivirga sp. SAORIC476]
MSLHTLPDAERTKRLTTAELRDRFLVQDLFQDGQVTFRFVDLDRVVLGGAVPTDGPLDLGVPEELAAGSFTERREVGILNIGGAGTVMVGEETYALGNRDLLYVGRGSEAVSFASDDAATPARYYLVSYPCHAEHPTTLIRKAEAELEELGSQAKANRRDLFKYVRPGGVESGQLVMGITEIRDGSVWNTMPAHTHARRTEVYLYFDVDPEDVVFHMMGEPQEVRTLLTRDGEAVLSPGWSIHAGAGTGAYTFCWAMGGENQDFGDMQFVAMTDLR